MMKTILLFLILISNFTLAQMPDISDVWLNNNKLYSGIIVSEKIVMKIDISEQDKVKDQEYFVSGYTLADGNNSKFEGKLIITKYKDSKNKSVIFGDYKLLEEPKGKHSGVFQGKFNCTFKWDKKSGKLLENQIIFLGNWKSYDNSLDFKTKIGNK